MLKTVSSAASLSDYMYSLSLKTCRNDKAILVQIQVADNEYMLVFMLYPCIECVYQGRMEVAQAASIQLSDTTKKDCVKAVATDL